MNTSEQFPSMVMAEAAMRVQLAAAELAIPDELQTVIRKWVTSLPFDNGQVGVEVAASVGLGRSTWRASGPTPNMIGPMLDFFDLVGVDTERQARLTGFGERVQPERLGHWVQMREEHVDAGWFAPIEIPLADALNETPQSEQREVFAGWCDDEDIEYVIGFERSLGPADYAGLWFQLPGADVSERVAAFEELMDDLELGSLPQTQRGVLTADENAVLVGSIWLIAEGVARIALGMIDPDPSILIALSIAVGADSDELLARVQGAFDADVPSLVEAVLYEGAADVEVAWTLNLSG